MSQNPRTIQLELTPEQKEAIIRFISDSGDAELDVGVVFKADVENGTVAPATFMVGSAV